MKTLLRFVIKFTSLVVAVLSCFDRVIFKGYLPITNGLALAGFVDHILKIRRCDFHPRFDGEVLTSCQKDCWPGARVKHRMKNSWLKMYDKFGLVLRIETVINNPREFRIRRWRTHEGRREKAWCPMNKSVINLYCYREVALAANERYLEALSVVENPAPTYRQTEKLTEPVVKAGRSYAGFNPASRLDVNLFETVLDGNHVVRGFRNADI